jgi:hypothetical protein
VPNRNLILLTCDYNYNDVLSEGIPSISRYALKIKADLKITYSEKMSFGRYHAILELDDLYDNILYLDSDVFISKNTPNLFEQNYDSLAFVRAFTHNNKHVKDLCEFATDYFGSDIFDENYYSFGGLILGKNADLKKLSKRVLEIEATLDKTVSKYFHNDELCLCIALKELYPDFKELDYKFMLNTFIDINKHEFYILHPFTKKDEKVKHLQKLNLLDI